MPFSLSLATAQSTNCGSSDCFMSGRVTSLVRVNSQRSHHIHVPGDQDGGLARLVGAG